MGEPGRIPDDGLGTHNVEASCVEKMHMLTSGFWLHIGFGMELVSIVVSNALSSSFMAEYMGVALEY
jgi:hypothetical protein